MSHWDRRVSTLIVTVLAACAVVAVVSADRREAQTPASPDPKFAEALQQGEDALRTKRSKSALEAFNRANAILNKKSAVALHGVARAHRLLGDFRSEANACKEALKHVGTDHRLAAILHNQRGSALFSLAEKPTDKVVKEAEVEFRAALALPSPPLLASYNLGVSLLRQSRDEEGLAILKTFVNSGWRTPELDIAMGLIENPRRAREYYAPEFALTTAQGESFSLKGLKGKVVFIDFWGQWCGPCRALTPNLLALHRKYQRDPNFVMIGVSSDSSADAQKWTDYIADQKMGWPQFLDLRRQVIPQFDVRVYPTGIVIGPDGVVLHREQGGGPGGLNVIDGVISKALKALAAPRYFLSPSRP